MDENGKGATASTVDRTTSAVLDSHGVSGLHFTDITEKAGLNEIQSNKEDAQNQTMSSGAAVADVNGDGFEDVFLTRIGRTDLLYINNGDGTFTESGREAGVSGPTTRAGSSAAAFFDADGDRDLDLFVSGFGKGSNHFYINDGKGRFRDEAGARGVLSNIGDDVDLSNLHGVAIADVNGDGHLDLLLLQWYYAMYSTPVIDQVTALSTERGDKSANAVAPCESSAIARKLGYPVVDGQVPSASALYINDGTGHFNDESAAFGLDFDQILAFTGVFQDIDDDGWPDLAITGDGCTSRLFRNVDGKSFEDITARAKVATDENGMGSVLRDIDGNGTADWFVTSIAYPTDDERCPMGGVIFGCTGNRLYLNDGRGGFTDGTDKFGLRSSGWSWGAAAEDFANNGTTQVVATNGYDIGDPGAVSGRVRDYIESFVKDPTHFWALDPNTGRYENVAKYVGITDSGLGHALVPFDMDNDGDLDLLIAQAGARPVLYRNDTPADRSWLTIRLLDAEHLGNSRAEGAKIEVVADDGSAPIVGWISSGGSYESQKPAEFHLGFGDRSAKIDRIDVYWPNDSTPQSVRSVELNQVLTIKRSG